MTRRHPITARLTLLSLLLLPGACSDSPTDPADPLGSDVFVLNSTGQTLASFSVLQGLSGSAPPIDLGAGFDGDAFDLTPSFAVTTVSSFGGSRLLFVDLASGRRPGSSAAGYVSDGLRLSGSAWRHEFLVGSRG